MKIALIGGGNGQSNLLSGLYDTLPRDIEITSIVSMSDDGRTTGELMRQFSKYLNIHLPPPGDLRRCLFSLSTSHYREFFMKTFETQFDFDEKICKFSILDLFREISKEILLKSDFDEKIYGDIKEFVNTGQGRLFNYILVKSNCILNYKMPLETSLKGHKFGNILMASIYYNLGNYNEMLYVMHRLLEVRGRVLPVTVNQATIQARLQNGQIIETQDRISNVADYDSPIVNLSLMEDSKTARYSVGLKEALLTADLIIIGPGDLYTSIISNLIIAGVGETLQKSSAEIVFVLNNTNKGGETDSYSAKKFVDTLEEYLGKQINYLVANNGKLNLSFEELEKFKNNISVKGGDYLYLTDDEKDYFSEKGIKVIEKDFIDKKTFYKHDKKAIAEGIYDIIKGEN